MHETRLALVISQDLDLASCTAARLQASGFKTITATRTRDGMRSAVEQQPSVIVLDASMPEIDGPQAIRWLREQQETRATPIVLVSEGNQDDEKARAAVQHWVRRPFKSGQLMAAVNDSIQSAELNKVMSCEALRRSSQQLQTDVVRTLGFLQVLTNAPHESAEESGTDSPQVTRLIKARTRVSRSTNREAFTEYELSQMNS